jgi:hypothetical protein
MHLLYGTGKLALPPACWCPFPFLLVLSMLLLLLLLLLRAPASDSVSKDSPTDALQHRLDCRPRNLLKHLQLRAANIAAVADRSMLPPVSHRLSHCLRQHYAGRIVRRRCTAALLLCKCQLPARAHLLVCVAG